MPQSASPQPPSQPSSAQPTPEQVQAEIHRQLIEAELRVRQWLNSPQAKRATEVAKVAAPIAGLTLVAGLAAWRGWTSHRRSRRWRRQVPQLVPIEEGSRPSLDFIRKSLLGQPRKHVRSLLGEPAVDRGGLQWIYGFDRVLKPGVHDPAAMALDFDDDGRTADVHFLVEPEPDSTDDAT